ncbi:pleckstrin homology domain-containing family G member 7-like isoform X2 [Octopus sinensis]|uniref:Pleckstrin homology domain-containing family G member 7-like isoform X2 n=1 Tax=Octopus sinensis TaxID=2607531 RepID=A0A6P7TC72_9MOLL|nr:pleckstrin homology domain-containing family G member 7-like isoform X2 [Octopus sinensis]
MSLRRKIWTRTVKLKRGLSFDSSLFTPRSEPPHLRRVSSGSLTSGSDESEGEPSPPLSRRGRRSAIYDAKNFGDVSPSTLSPELSPSNSCDEGEGGSNLAGRLRRRRSSVDIPMTVYPGDLLGHRVPPHNKKLTKRNTVADFATRQDLPTIYSESVADSKKSRQTFSLLRLMKTRSKENLTQLEEVLMKLKPSEFRDNTLIGYKNLHWSDLIASPDTDADPLRLSCKELKRREAVWELFKSEVIFLVDHLMVLKHCFMEPLKKCQVEGHLMFAEPRYLFGNLDEICYVSYTFCKDFLSALLKSMSSTQFGSTSVFIKAFQRFSCHSKDGDVYHVYCLNYMNAMNYLEQLRKHEEFCEFEKWCEQDARCNRLQVPDLLVAPIQHCTKLPLMLSNVRAYTEEEEERQQITDSIEKVESSLYELEDKMKWLKNYERVREIHQQLIWPTIQEIDPRVYIPDFMKHMLQKQPCEKLLTCPKRQLIHEGQLSLIETTKTLDAYLFLFDDILIITKYKKSPRKHQRQAGIESVQRQNIVQTLDRGTFTVYRQPIALDRLIMHELTPSESMSCGLKNTFMLLHISRFQQVIGVYTLQACNETSKGQWVTTLKDAKEKYADKHGQNPENSDRTSTEATSLRSEPSSEKFPDWTPLKYNHPKSKSMDVVHF